MNLVLAVATAAASAVLGALPTRALRSGIVTRQVLCLGGAWLVVALLSPSSIFHFYILLALLCFVAWWQLRRENLLRGKLWLWAAAGLGLSLGVVLILMVTPRAWPMRLSF